MKFLMATVLTSCLSLVAFAGDVPTGDLLSPPSGTTQQNSPGEIPTSGAPQPISGFAVGLIQDMVGWLAM